MKKRPEKDRAHTGTMESQKKSILPLKVNRENKPIQRCFPVKKKAQTGTRKVRRILYYY